LKLALVFGKKAQVEYRRKLAEERLAELVELVKEKRVKFIDDLVEDYKENIEKGNKIAEIARKQGKNMSGVDEIVALATSIHVDVLKEVLEKVPEQAKSAIQKAINSSRKGGKEALERLQEEEPEKASEIHFQIAERKLKQARDKAEEGKEEEVKEFLEEYEESMEKTAEIAEKSRALGKDTSSVDKVVKEATSKHVEVLEGIKEKVPEQAKPAIQKAIKISEKGREKAVEVSGKGREETESAKSEEKSEESEGEQEKTAEKKQEEKEISEPVASASSGELGESAYSENSIESSVEGKGKEKSRIEGHTILDIIKGWFS
jgi:hypothetical protein